ncbi:MAG TPA: hypothetical protein VF821_26315 [Lentzea sp.]
MPQLHHCADLSSRIGRLRRDILVARTIAESTDQLYAAGYLGQLALHVEDLRLKVLEPCRKSARLACPEDSLYGEDQLPF